MFCQILPALLAGLLCSAPPSLSTDLVGYVERVHDGDTFTLNGNKIRLWGVDAPELAQQCTRGKREKVACGTVARDALRTMVRGEKVVCTQVERDRYKRIVATCQVGGRDVGELMVRSGNALKYQRYSGGRYQRAERAAQDRRAGVWAGEFTEPWRWRRQKG